MICPKNAWITHAFVGISYSYPISMAVMSMYTRLVQHSIISPGLYLCRKVALYSRILFIFLSHNIVSLERDFVLSTSHSKYVKILTDIVIPAVLQDNLFLKCTYQQLLFAKCILPI